VCEQGLWQYRLAHKAICSDFCGFPVIVFVVVAGEHKNGNITSVRHLADMTGGFPAVHAWHFNIHYDGIKRLLFDRFHGLYTIGSQACRVAFHVKDNGEQRAGIRRIINEQDSHGVAPFPRGAWNGLLWFIRFQCIKRALTGV
jgi:hypothetical protein